MLQAFEHIAEGNQEQIGIYSYHSGVKINANLGPIYFY